MTQDTFFVTLPPRQLREIAGWDVIPAHLAYRVGRGPHLLRAGGPAAPSGGMMVLEPGGFAGGGPIGAFCQEVVRECQGRGFSGAVLDFDGRLPPLEQMAAVLDESFARRGWTLCVPESYGLCAPRARVLISSALSGGALDQRLEEAGERFGRERIVLALERVAEDFSLPSPTGRGCPLDAGALAQLLDRLRPSVFFSAELCARYFTYMNRESGAHFVLFDDEDTLCRKVETARRAGITRFLAPWTEIANCAARMGVRRKERGALKTV